MPLVAARGVRNQKAEVVVFDVSDNLRHVLQDLGHLLFPRLGVADDVGDVAFLRIGLIGRPRGVKVHEAGASHGVIGLRDGQEALHARVGRHDGLVDAVAGIVGILGQEEELRERVVLQRQALAQPPADDGHKVGEEPRLRVLLLVAEVMVVDFAGDEERHFLLAAVFQVVERVDRRLADDGGVLHLRGHVLGREGQFGIVGERGFQALGRQVVAVAVDAREGDFAGDTVF